MIYFVVALFTMYKVNDNWVELHIIVVVVFCLCLSYSMQKEDENCV